MFADNQINIIRQIIEKICDQSESKTKEEVNLNITKF